jgi:Amt family ammonium transporter
MRYKSFLLWSGVLSALFLTTGLALGQDAPPDPMARIAALEDDANILWVCIAAFLVFFMQAGFALVETGLTRAKNACNILMKNLMDFCIGAPLFWLVGAGLMFGSAGIGGLFGKSGFLWDPAEGGSAFKEGASVEFGWAFLLFQTVFCATAATIISGAVAERTKFGAYLIYTAAVSLFVYPIFGCWAWNSLWYAGSSSGWLGEKGFTDFAGSTVVHSIGGWAALAGAIVVGPRLGKYRNGKVNPIPGHNITLAALGVFILWLGWFGFNPGSTTAVNSSFAYIAVNTNLAACAGAISAMTVSWILFKKPDTSFTLNGALAGLVSITAGCDLMTPAFALLAGLIGGVLVVFAVLFFDKIRVDDPVGAISVHGVCGAWGTLAVGLFCEGKSIGVQLLGIGTAFAWAFGVSFVIFYLIKLTIGMRVSPDEEMKGLDLSEHGMEAYAGFAMVSGREPYSPGAIVFEPSEYESSHR